MVPVEAAVPEIPRSKMQIRDVEKNRTSAVKQKINFMADQF